MTLAQEPPDIVLSATDQWFAFAAELAQMSPAVADGMRAEHRKGPDGCCRGPHGVRPEPWPCSSRLMADAAERVRMDRWQRAQG